MYIASKNNKSYFKLIDRCPLCNSKKFSQKIYNYPNRYSEQISKILNIEEDFLIKELFNYKCANCELVFKNKWFKKKILQNLYKNIIPLHPKGWDTNSNRFSKTIFQKDLNKYLITKKKNLRDLYKV